jgi:transcriptional regulator of acetoin/glycerol metabolism
VAHLPARLQPPDREDTTLPVAPVAGVDLRELLNAVRDSGGNIGGAALRLGITRERAYRLIDRLGLVRGSA